MTAPSTGAPGGPRPPLLTAAAGLMGVTAAMSIVSALVNFFSRTYVGCLVSVSKALGTKPAGESQSHFNQRARGMIDACQTGGTPRPATGPDLTSALIQPLISGVLFLLVFGVLAVLLLKGRPTARWGVVGLWVLSVLGGLTPFGVQNAYLFAVAHGVPVLYRAAVVLGALAFLVAVVLVNLPPVTRYLNARRPYRPSASGRPAPQPGLRGLFSVRPPTGGTGAGPAGGVSMTKGAPAAGSAPGRATAPRPGARAKVRAAEPTAPPPAGPPPARPRGKSRRGAQ